MGIPRHTPASMTAADFFAFTESRQGDEKWELIAGEPVMSPSANDIHQTIVGNLLFALRVLNTASWKIIPGIGVIVSEASVPVPDLLVRPATVLGDWKCDDLIVAFEVLSPSTADHDLRWKRKAYAQVSSLQHYVVVAQDTAEVIVYDRASDFAERRIEGINSQLDLPALDARIALKDIYFNTGIES